MRDANAPPRPTTGGFSDGTRSFSAPRLSVAEHLQPRLAQVRAEATRLARDKALLTRHNKHLLLELDRLQMAARRAGVDATPAAPEVVANAAREQPPTVLATAEALSWPQSAADTMRLHNEHEELQRECRAQGKELASLRRRLREAEQQAVQAQADATYAMAACQEELMPAILSVKRDVAEGVLWDDSTKLNAVIELAGRIGVPDHRVAHLITRTHHLQVTAHEQAAYPTRRPGARTPNRASSAGPGSYASSPPRSRSPGAASSSVNAAASYGSLPGSPSSRRAKPAKLRAEVAEARTSPPGRGKDQSAQGRSTAELSAYISPGGNTNGCVDSLAVRIHALDARAAVEEGIAPSFVHCAVVPAAAGA